MLSKNIIRWELYVATSSRSNMFSPDLQGEADVQHFFYKSIRYYPGLSGTEKSAPEEDRNGPDFTMKNLSLFGENMVHKGTSR